MEAPPVRQPKNLDIQCLRCGARNIVENHICGNCGANLPIIYDEAGKILKWQEDPYYGAVFKSKTAPQTSPLQKKLMLRLGLIGLAILAAVLILKRH